MTQAAASSALPPDAAPAIELDAAVEVLPDAVAVMHRAFAPLSATGTPSGALVETAQTLAEERATGGRVAVARLDGRVVAMVKHHNAADGTRYFGRLSVEPELRGRGLARALVEALRDAARADGRTGLSCLVRESEAGNVALYLHLGLEVVGRSQRVSRLGATIDVVEMRDPAA